MIIWWSWGGGPVSYERGTPISDGRDGRVPEGDLQAALLAALASLLLTVFTGAMAPIADIWRVF